MTKKINLVLGIHNHQPVGNFDFVFDNAYQKAYKPFLDILSRYPEIKLGMHFTGIVLDWIDRQYPEFLTRIRAMVDNGQIELIGGGFYEPIMAVIPDADKLGQIEKLSSYCESKLGQRPRGMWVAERVWEPHLPKPLSQAGMKYIILDDTHFMYAGKREEELRGYFVTEEEGYKLNAFPISKKLRYTIPFQEPEKTIEYLKAAADVSGETLLVFADDGEKFGIWPETYKHVYEDRWLEKFFDALMENRSWINLLHFSEAMTQLKPTGRVYIPTASYAEMSHWALPSESYRLYEDFESRMKKTDPEGVFSTFVRGGFWRNFSTKYAEINKMHKKMLRLSKRLQLTKAALPTRDSEKASLLEVAQDHLWASQCNCPYWHGVFGGVYLNNIRYAMYREMLLCEKFMDTADYGDATDWSVVEEYDFDTDGLDEILVETHALNLYFTRHQGASVFELDYKDVPVNLADTMQRREEGYHDKLRQKPAVAQENRQNEIASIHDRILSKEANLDDFLIFDDGPRHTFVDRFFAQHLSVEQVYKGNYKDHGNFAFGEWGFQNRSVTDRICLVFEKDGRVDKQPVHVRKTFEMRPGTSDIAVKYEITNKSEQTLLTSFGTEINLTMLAGKAHDRYYYIDDRVVEDRMLGSKGNHETVKSMGLKDEWLQTHVRLEFDRETDVWWYPVETVSMSEDGFEKVYQNSCVIPRWPVSLEPKGRLDVTLKMTISRSL